MRAETQQRYGRAVAAVVLVGLGAGCSSAGTTPADVHSSASSIGSGIEQDQRAGSSGASASSLAEAAESAAQVPHPSRPPPGTPGSRVLAISLDGLNPAAIKQLGSSGAPVLHRLMAEGAATLNARTEVEQTITLPNHTGMLTGRRVEASRGGHGVAFNDDDPGSTTVQEAAGGEVTSIFDVVHESGGTTALFAAKTKFSLFQRSWPDSIDRFEVDTNNASLVDSVCQDLATSRRTFTFLHLSLPDVVGHESGFMSPDYLVAVRRTDALVGEVLDTVTRTRALEGTLSLIVTADHGGLGEGHSDANSAANFRIPFIVWGRRVIPGDLYDLDPGYIDPGVAQPPYGGPQPVRNGDVANLAASILGLGPLPGSELDAAQDLGPFR